MQIEDHLTLINTILDKGDSILFPADGIWGISCNSLNPVASTRVLEQAEISGSYVVELLVSDIDMLKKYTSNLHPRIETLLVYHERPIRIKCLANNSLKLIQENYNLYFRIVKDKACRILINEIKFPILFVSFLENDAITQIPLSRIKTNNLENVEFIAHEQSIDEETIFPLIKIAFDNEGLIRVLK